MCLLFTMPGYAMIVLETVRGMDGKRRHQKYILKNENYDDFFAHCMNNLEKMKGNPIGLQSQIGFSIYTVLHTHSFYCYYDYVTYK